MDERLRRIASVANDLAYGDDVLTKDYIDAAPHIKHAALRDLYCNLVLEVYDAAAKFANPPRVLDLGAGEGSVTLPFLRLGAHVLAVDLSENQLNTLRDKCQGHEDRLEIRCEDVYDTLADEHREFDIIAVNSFLHHIPDYLSLIRKATSLLSNRGLFFSFQDPLRYATVGLSTRLFTDVGYSIWRLKRGPISDVIGGFSRRLRLSRGIYRDNCRQDNAEYHVVRQGVDQDAIVSLFESLDFDCRMTLYYSSHHNLFQKIGKSVGIVNHFSMIAQRRAPVDALQATST
jgi:SAM-dependent methyltransferase